MTEYLQEMVKITFTHGKEYTISHVVTVRIGGVMRLQKIVTTGSLAK